MFFCTAITDISAKVTPIGMKFCMMIPERSSPLLEAVPQGIPEIPNYGLKFWPLNREYLENGKSQRYIMSIRLNFGC